MKRFFLLFMAVTLSVFVLVGCGSDQSAGTITELQATINDLQNQVEEYSALKTELDSANNMIAELQSQMDALTAEKDEMSARLEVLYKIEPVDEIMYTIAEANIYDDLYGEALGEEPAGTIPEGEEIRVTGKSTVIDWYEIEIEGKNQYISASLVSGTQQPSGGNSGGSSGNGGSGGNGNGGSSGGNGNSGGGSSQPTESTPPPAQNEPNWNVGDVMGENESGANDMIYGGEIDYSGF